MDEAALSDSLFLCYHAVSPTWPAPLSVTPTALEAQLEVLSRRGYRSTTFTELALRRGEGRRVAITFDDAYRSVLELGMPILERFGYVATVFVPTGFIDRGEPLAWPGTEHWLGTPHQRELTPLTWDELGGLRDSGWEIGSHTCSHPRLSTLGDDELEAELVNSRNACATRTGACRSLAYPYGDWDQRVERAAGRAGYEAAGTLPARLTPPRALARPRIGIYQSDDLRRFRRKVSRGLRVLRASPAWSLVRRVSGA